MKGGTSSTSFISTILETEISLYLIMTRIGRLMKSLPNHRLTITTMMVRWDEGK